MGANLKIITFHDAARHGFQIRITCGGCGRSAIYATVHVIEWFHAKRRNMALEASGNYFRCIECDHKGARVELVAPHRAPDLPVMQPSAYERVQAARKLRG